MAATKETPTASTTNYVNADAQDSKEPPKGTKRQRNHAESSRDTTGIATPESLPSKRRRKEPASAAEDAAVKEVESHKEKAKEARKAHDEAEKALKEEEKTAKQKEKEAKQMRVAEARERKAKERAAIKAVKKAEKQWEDYCSAHAYDGAPLAEEPEESITQTDAREYYTLKPNELCLAHHPRVNNLCK